MSEKLSLRFRAALNVLLDRPTIYGVHFVRPKEGQTVRLHETMNTPGTLMASCCFDSSALPESDTPIE